MFGNAVEKRMLCSLLKRAESKLRALGTGPIWSSFDSGVALADFVLKARSGIKNNAISPADKSQLWYIFAPTCDWDDTVGDVDLGNSIFALLNGLYGEVVKSGLRKTDPPESNAD